jgi:hypothetical protein
MTAFKHLKLEYRDKHGLTLKTEDSPMRGKIGAKLWAKRYLDPSKGLNSLRAHSISVVGEDLVVEHDPRAMDLEDPSKSSGYRLGERTLPLDELMRKHERRN